MKPPKNRPPIKLRWQKMDSAPKGVTVEVRTKNGRTLEAHFAQDLSGEEQPPFKGWFRYVSETSCAQIDDPIAWRPIVPNQGERECR